MILGKFSKKSVFLGLELDDIITYHGKKAK